MEKSVESKETAGLKVKKKRKEDGRYIYYYFPVERGGES